MKIHVVALAVMGAGIHRDDIVDETTRLATRITIKVVGMYVNGQLPSEIFIGE